MHRFFLRFRLFSFHFRKVSHLHEATWLQFFSLIRCSLRLFVSRINWQTDHERWLLPWWPPSIWGKLQLPQRRGRFRKVPFCPVSMETELGCFEKVVFSYVSMETEHLWEASPHESVLKSCRFLGDGVEKFSKRCIFSGSDPSCRGNERLKRRKTTTHFHLKTLRKSSLRRKPQKSSN